MEAGRAEKSCTYLYIDREEAKQREWEKEAFDYCPLLFFHLSAWSLVSYLVHFN
jgi:hypothetical protein